MILKSTLTQWILGLLLVAAPCAVHATVVEVGTDSIGIGGAGTAVIDLVNRKAYFGSARNSEIAIVDLTTFVGGSSFFVPNGPSPILASAVDFAGQTIYIGGGDSGSNAADFPVPFLTPVITTATFPSSLQFQTLTTAVFDAKRRHIIYGTFAAPSQIIEANAGTFVLIASTTLSSSSNFIGTAAIDPSNDFAYFGSTLAPGNVTKINLADLSITSTLTFAAGEGGIGSVVVDTTTNSAYFGTHDSPAKVIRVNLSTFQETGHLLLQPGENDLTSVVGDADFAYFGTNTAPAHIVKVRFSDLSEIGVSLTLPAGEDNLTTAVIDPAAEFAYFATNALPSTVLKFDLLGGPPEITTQPRNSDVHAGASATFTIRASGRLISYQWQKNNIDIPGATLPVFEETGVALDENGSTFHCVVSNSSGTVTSTNGILTVLPVVRVFPNPWRADRHAGIPMTFDGLPAQSTVKIYTLDAQWVKSLPSTAGSVTWDRTNDAGQRVATGYYYYSVDSSDSNQNVQGKLAIIK